MDIYIHIYIYIRSICRQQLFRSLRAHQYSSDQKKMVLSPEIKQTLSITWQWWKNFAYGNSFIHALSFIIQLIWINSSLFSSSNLLAADDIQAFYDHWSIFITISWYFFCNLNSKRIIFTDILIILNRNFTSWNSLSVNVHHFIWWSYAFTNKCTELCNRWK